jgi:2-oxoglutarate ferredoxin oxidoreductase subunit beta
VSNVVKLKPKDYKSDLKSVWCPGCGDFGVLGALTRALAELQLAPEEVAVISGIGCSSRLPGYVDTYGFNTIHGRSLPIATGLKTGRPDLNVVCIAGDGDCYSIGAGHLPHAVRRNVNLTLVVLDNFVYGLTKGQNSPTTPLGDKINRVSPTNVDRPVNPLASVMAYGAPYVAQGFSAEMKDLAKLIADGMRYPGFAIINALSPCVTFRGNDEFDRVRGFTYHLDESYDPTDRTAAIQHARQEDGVPIGLLYREDPAPPCTPHQDWEPATDGPEPAEWTDVLDQFRA